MHFGICHTRVDRSVLFVSAFEVNAIIETSLLKTGLIKLQSAITHGNCSSALERQIGEVKLILLGKNLQNSKAGYICSGVARLKLS